MSKQDWEKIEYQLRVVQERLDDIESNVLKEEPPHTLKESVRNLILAPSRAYIGTALIGIIIVLIGLTVSLGFTNEQLDRFERFSAIAEKLIDRLAQ